MKDNPFAAYAAGSKKKPSNNDGDWMTTKKVGRDDSAIKKSKTRAAEERKSKNRRGGAAAKNKKGGGGKGAKVAAGKKRRKDGFIDDSDDESFHGYSEEEEDDEEDDGFIVKSDDDDGGDIEIEDEGDWDSNMEEEDDDDDSDFGGKKKKKKKKGAKVAKGKKAAAARANSRTTPKSSWKPPSSQNDSDDDIEEGSPMPPSRGQRGNRVAAKNKKKVVESPISLDSDEEMSDDIYADNVTVEGKGKKPNIKTVPRSKILDSSPGQSSSASAIDLSSPSPPPAKPNKMSKYFAKNDDDESFGEEKKEEEDDANVMNGARKKNNDKRKRMVLDDDSDDDDWGKAKAADNAAAADDLFDDGLDDTPKKSPRKSKPTGFSPKDYANDEEACAIQAAMKASLADTDDAKEHKRLKKKKKKSKMSSSSSLEQIKLASPPKEAPQYKDDEELLQDSEEDDMDDEIEVYEAAEVDEEEQTAAQVLAEANALSAKIIKIVSGWCGGSSSGSDGNASGGNIKGLILGNEEALSLGGDSKLAAEDGKQAGKYGESDDMWISNDTMKKLLPKVTLAEYQLLGVNWMALLNRIKFGGNGKKQSKKGGKKGGMNVNGILADEMGLGKTVQTIAFLAWLNHQKKNSNSTISSSGQDEDVQVLDETSSAKCRPHLIVVPASVLTNWMNEFKKFAPDMIVEKYYGNQAERDVIREEMDMNYLRGNNSLDAVLTTFSYFSSDSNKGDRSFLRKFEFDYLVVDEGHTLKNPKGLRYMNLNKFQTSHRLLLTGTPVQNSPKELMSLLTFLMPLFDRKTKSSKRNRGDDSDDENDGGERMLEYFVHLEGGSGDDAKAYRKLKELFAPFVLRRKKEDVLGQLLPPKTRRVDIVPMDEATQTSYDAIISAHVKARTQKNSKDNAAAQKHLFTTLRKAANHPLLLRNRFNTEEEKDNLAHLAMDYGWFGNDASCTLQLVRDELDKFSDYGVHCAAQCMIEDNPSRSKYLDKYTLMENDLFCSPKMVRLRTLLPDLIGEGHRILIFSQWTKVLDLMGHLLHSLQMSNYLRLDGSTAVSTRQDLLNTFTNDPSIPVFLLSTRAGGMGLNLTAADVCILHDLDFNPFNDLQAEDRCHRIGQKKPVTIIKLVTAGTVDEDIYKIQERKSKMNEAIMEEGGKRSKKPSDNTEMCKIANSAILKFLKSPTRPATSAKCSTAPVINID